ADLHDRREGERRDPRWLIPAPRALGAWGAAQGCHYRQADDGVERAVTYLQAADARVGEALGQSLERPAQVKGIEGDEGCQGTGEDALEGQEEKEDVGQGEEGQAGGEGA